MKRLMTLFLIALLMFAAVGCQPNSGSSKNKSEASSETAASETTGVPSSSAEAATTIYATPDEFSFDDDESAEERLQRLIYEPLRTPKAEIKADTVLQYPELPTGCESVALTIALRSLGFKLEKTDIAENYLIHDEDVMYGYAGDPFEEDGAGVFPPGLTDTANNYLADQGSDYVALNTMGTDFEDLYKIISAGYPVVLWTTMYFTPPLIEDYGYFYGEDVYYWYHSEHCVTLTGYDTETGMVTISDPLTGIVKCKAKDIEDIYNKTGKLSMAIIKGSPQQNWQADDYDYEIMG